MFYHTTTPGNDHQHVTVAEAIECDIESAQMHAELEAENAWLRAAEAGAPDTWRDEDLERMAEAYGTPIPPSYV